MRSASAIVGLAALPGLGRELCRELARPSISFGQRQGLRQSSRSSPRPSDDGHGAATAALHTALPREAGVAGELSRVLCRELARPFVSFGQQQGLRQSSRSSPRPSDDGHGAATAALHTALPREAGVAGELSRVLCRELARPFVSFGQQQGLRQSSRSSPRPSYDGHGAATAAPSLSSVLGRSAGARKIYPATRWSSSAATICVGPWLRSSTRAIFCCSSSSATMGICVAN